MSNDRHKAREHAIETAALLGCAALAAVSLRLGTHVPGWLLPVTEIVAGLVIGLATWAGTGRGALSVFCAAFGTGLGLWTAWAELTRVWNWAVIGAWLIGMIISVPWAAHAAAGRASRASQLAIGAADPGAEAEAAKRAEMAKFEHMFREVGCEGVQVVDLEKGRAGRTVRLQLPRSGKVTLTTLEQSAGNIAVILRVKEGGIEFWQGADASDIFMRTREKNVLGDVVRLRPELRAKTINERFAIGIQEDGTVLRISLRELHLFLAGTTGAGKSNIINVLLAQLSYMPDTLIWAMDMKGGRTAKPWLQAWIEGKADAPAIDWVATTREEAVKMATAFQAAVNGRANSGIGGTKMTPKPDRPQIILICDEMAELVGEGSGTKLEVGADGTTNYRLLKILTNAVQKARSEACTSIWATQRGTNDMAGSGTLKGLCKLRLALGVSTAADLQWIIPDVKLGKKALATMADTPGVGLFAVGSRASQLSKFFWHDHIEDQCWEGENEEAGCVPACPVYQTSIDVGNIRPRLDQKTAAVLGEDYARRWDRVMDQPALAPMFQRSGGARTAVAVPAVDTSRFDEIVRDLPDPEKSLSPIHKRALEILASQGVRGASPYGLRRMLANEGIMVDRDYARETLQRWLAKSAQDGIIHSADPGRWVYGPKKDDKAA